MIKSIAFFHGLESDGPGRKGRFLESLVPQIHAPTMVYRNPDFVEKAWAEALSIRPEVVVGSSMGGWFGLHVGVSLDVPMLLVNPAVVGRSLELNLEGLGPARPEVHVLIGKEDELIDGEQALAWLRDRRFPVRPVVADCGHRVPPTLFEPWASEVLSSM